MATKKERIRELRKHVFLRMFRTEVLALLFSTTLLIGCVVGGSYCFDGWVSVGWFGLRLIVVLFGLASLILVITFATELRRVLRRVSKKNLRNNERFLNRARKALGLEKEGKMKETPERVHCTDDHLQ